MKWLEAFPDSRAALVVAILSLAYVLSIGVVPSRSLPPRVDVSITATGKKNPASAGSEVWVLQAPGLDTEFIHPGWQRRANDVLVAPSAQRASLAWQAPTGSTRAIELFRHPYSGVAKVRLGLWEAEFDLYSEQSDQIRIPITRSVEEVFGRSIHSAASLAFFTIFSVVAVRAFVRRFGFPDTQESLFILLSAAIGAHVLLENKSSIGGAGTFITLCWFLFVTWSELLLVRLIVVVYDRRVGLVALELALLSLMSLLNFYVTFALNLVSFQFWSWFSGAAFFFISAMWASRLLIARRAMYSFCVIFVTVAVAKALLFQPDYKIRDLSVTEKVSRSDARQNIYFISFDGVASPSAFRPLFGVDRIPLWEILEKNEFSIRSAKSAGKYTLETFYRIFTRRFDVAKPSFDFLLGYDSSPILDRLKKAGYQIQSIQGSSFFGLLNNTWDYSYPAKRAPFDYCWSVQKPLFFWGACRIPFTRAGFDRQFMEVEERVSVAASRRGGPWFTFVHVLSPGHTDSSYAYTNEGQRRSFVATYLSRLDSLYQPLESLLSKIGKSDPNAVVIFHSDHGAWITKGWPAAAENVSLREMDQSSVPLAVRPANFCSQRLSAVADTSEVLPSVFDCLGF